MASTRITVYFEGLLAVRPAPLELRSESGLVFSDQGNYAASARHWSSRRAQVASATWGTLENFAALGATGARILGIQVKNGPALLVRITRQVGAQIVVAAAPALLLTFPDEDLATLVEVSNDASGTTDFEFEAAGS